VLRLKSHLTHDILPILVDCCKMTAHLGFVCHMHAKGIPATKQICKINLLTGRLVLGHLALAAACLDIWRLLPSLCPAFLHRIRACSLPRASPLGPDLTVHTCGGNHRARCHQEQQRRATPGHTLLLPASCCWRMMMLLTDRIQLE
jgi:hypothetical protein